MTDETPRAAFKGRVSKAAAEEILRAAADLDTASDEMIDVEELRIAADHAGISAQSFEISVAEYERASSDVQKPSAAYDGAVSPMRIAGVGVLGAATVVTAISLVLGPAPGDIIQGAVAAGAGSITAVIAYLRIRSHRGSHEPGPSRALRPEELLQEPL